MAEPLLVIASVDNEMTRHVLLDEVQKNFSDFIWVCPANAYHTTQVSVYIKDFNKPDVFVHPFQLYNNLANPTDSIPTGGCENETPSSPQIIAANCLAAVQTLGVITCLLDQQPVYSQIVGDVYSSQSKGIGEPVIIGDEWFKMND